MTTIVIVAIAAFMAGMGFLRVVAPLTKTKVDDKLLAAGEKVEPAVLYVKGKVTPK